MSLGVLSARLDVHRSLLSRYERGVHAIPIELTTPWAALLDLRVEVLLLPLSDSSLLELQNLCAKLEPADRDLVAKMVARLVP